MRESSTCSNCWEAGKVALLTGKLHQILNLVEVALQQANQAFRLIDQSLRPDHGLLKLLHGFVYAEDLVESASDHIGQCRLDARQACRQHGATRIKAELSPCRPGRREHENQGENCRAQFVPE